MAVDIKEYICMDMKTEQSRSRYNKLADYYDNSFDGRFTLPYNQLICDYLKLCNKDSVLDVACGNGRLLKMLAKKANINVNCIDISEDMIATAQNSLKNGIFRVSTADKIVFADCSFEYVTVCCAFHHFINPDIFMKEAFRLLKDNGKLVIADPLPPSFIRWVENLLIPRMNMGDVKIYSIKELLEFYKSAGFTDVCYKNDNGKIIIEGRKRLDFQP